MERTPTELGRIVRDRRFALGMKQVEVVEAAERAFGVVVFTEPTYRAVETGRGKPSDRTLSGISQALGWSSDALARISAGADPDDFETRLSAGGKSLDALAETDPDLYASLQAVVAAARRSQGQ